MKGPSFLCTKKISLNLYPAFKGELFEAYKIINYFNLEYTYNIFSSIFFHRILILPLVIDSVYCYVIGETTCTCQACSFVIRIRYPTKRRQGVLST